MTAPLFPLPDPNPIRMPVHLPPLDFAAVDALTMQFYGATALRTGRMVANLRTWHHIFVLGFRFFGGTPPTDRRKIPTRLNWSGGEFTVAVESMHIDGYVACVPTDADREAGCTIVVAVLGSLPSPVG